MDPIIHQFRDKFFEEANSLLDRLEKDLIELEKNPHDKELIESAFRAMHTIKGVSGMYGFEYVSSITHSMESIYQAVRDGAMEFNRNIFDITFNVIDHIRKLLTDEQLANPENQANHTRLENEVIAILASSQEVMNNISDSGQAYNIFDESVHTWHILMRTHEKMFFRGINLVAIFQDLSQLGTYQIIRLDYMSTSESDTWSIILSSKASESEIRDVFLFIEDDCTITCISGDNIFEHDFEKDISSFSEGYDEQSILDYIEHGSKSKTEEKAAAPENRIPKGGIIANLNNEKAHIKRISVDSTKLDHLMYLVSELITVNSQLLQSTRSKQFETIRPFVEKVDSLSKQFRNNAFDIRLIPLSDTVLRFQRLIRDLSKQLQKKIELTTHGIDTELDKNTIDQLHEPLMHLIRNCIDHGIEMPEERLRKGKPETGIISISASNSGNYVVIKIEDDGAGINLEKVRLKAVEKGILKLSDQPSRKEIYDLIFLPGFSTAKSLTDVSGRGVGMDVVRKRILDLRGDVTVESTEGEGTSFILKLQQSIAIIDTLLFKVEDNFFSVPVSDIKICSQISRAEINLRRHTGTIPFDQNLIPFIDIREVFNLEGEYSEKIKVVILSTSNGYLALLTDKIIGEHQAVLKPLGKSFHNQKFITSASQLGDGNLAFMIDTNEISSSSYTISKSIKEITT
jgi:two-component system chemotaxis sensor kinase CheA